MKFNKVISLAASLTITASTSIADTSLFDGLYKPRGEEFAHWNCAIIGEDGGALSISENRVTLIEESCALANPIASSEPSSLSFDAFCAIEGTQYETQVTLSKTDFGVIFSSEGFSAEWENCGTQSATLQSEGAVQQQDQATANIDAVPESSEEAISDLGVATYDGRYIIELEHAEQERLAAEQELTSVTEALTAELAAQRAVRVAALREQLGLPHESANQSQREETEKDDDAANVSAEAAAAVEAEQAEQEQRAEQHYNRFLSLNQQRDTPPRLILQSLRQAAEMGHAAAQHNLGYVYEKGQGPIEKDLEEARRWYVQSADQGFEPSANRLEALAIDGPAYRPQADTRYVAILKCGNSSFTTSFVACANHSALTIVKNSNFIDYVIPGPRGSPTDKSIYEAGRFFGGQLFVELPSNFQITMRNSDESGLVLSLSVLELQEGSHWRSIWDGSVICQQSARNYADGVYCASPT